MNQDDVVAGFREAISGFLASRVEKKKKSEEKKGNKKTGTLFEVSADNPEQLSRNSDDDKMSLELSKKNIESAWIENAALRVSQLGLATHIAKAAHQNSRGSSLYADPRELTPHGYVGSYLLGHSFSRDVVGNAAALDVYKFLSLEFGGTSLLHLILEERPEVYQILSDDPAQGEELAGRFSKIARRTNEKLSSHNLAKQVYWMVGDAPINDENYHLLLPLFESSLVQKIHEIIQEDLYGSAAKEAREARRTKRFSSHEIHEYTDLAIRKLGGANQQNISQLNSERGGVNYLLASLPPVWKERPASPLWGTTSFFDRAGRRPEMKSLLLAMKSFLEGDPPPNLESRIRRDEFVDQIILEIFLYLDEIHSLAPGWSSDPRCRLSSEEKFLLDPKGVVSPPPEWKEKIRHRFGNWLNHEFGKILLMGYVEHDYFSEMLEGEPWDSFLGSLVEKETTHA